MSNKGFSYGMSYAVQQKIAGKKDVAQEKAAQEWIEAITEIKFDSGKSYEENLHDGTILLQLAKKIDPKAKLSINKGKQPFAIMENIEKFLTWAQKYGVLKADCFQVSYLYELSNIPSVTATLSALGSQCQKKPQWDPSSPEYKNWPTFGPKPAQENVREFDEKTLAEGKKVIGIQAGTNKLASQAGQSFGGRRQIN